MTFVTGWHPSRIVACEMHTVHLGIAQWLNAGAVLLLAKFGYLGPGGLALQLEVLTRRFNSWCQLNSIRSGMLKQIVSFKPQKYLVPNLFLFWFNSGVMSC